jgi:ribosomal protein S18 acetylase RimI-like enzyme
MIPAIAGTEARDSAISAIVMAFSTDPAARWAYPDAALYLKYLPKFVDAFGGRAFDCGSAWQAGESAAALWLPPGEAPNEEALIACVRRAVPVAVQPDLFTVFEQMGNTHPARPHWYLPLIGVDPMAQGRGMGSALLEEALEIVDRDRAAAYLECSNPRNLPLYERHGFRLMGTIQAGVSPKLYPMIRPSWHKRHGATTKNS